MCCTYGIHDFQHQQYEKNSLLCVVSVSNVCIDTVAPICEDGAIQLVNGDFQSEGTIQICMDGQWGTVCDDLFGVEEAKVVCRVLNLTDGQLY